MAENNRVIETGLSKISKLTLTVETYVMSPEKYYHDKLNYDN